jgi:protein SCO1/2
VIFFLAGIAVAWGQSDVYEQSDTSNQSMNMHDHSTTRNHKMHAMRSMSADEHAAHRAAMAKKTDFKISMENYDVPDVELIDESGAHVALRTVLAADHPVAVNFIFTTCTTICPVMTATFAQMRKELGSEAERIRLVSITIDPEHDTPVVLAKYAEHFDATSGWRFLTGNSADVERVLRNFDAWTGSKTNHRPVTLLRSQGDAKWVRLEGLGSGIALAKQARTVIQ